VHVRGLEEPIRCTPEHPVWSRTQERWVGAGELGVGEELAGIEGGEEPPSGGAGAAGTSAAAAAHAPALVVERVVWTEAPAEVWNLEVHRAHTYRVGGAGVLVHNAANCPADGDIVEAELIAGDKLIPGDPVTFDQAVDIVANGGEVIAGGNRGLAYRIAEAAGEGRPPVHHNRHGARQRNHYHRTDANGNKVDGGHVHY
jgi:hypothetical protein